jgi:hypothetical protein
MHAGCFGIHIAQESRPLAPETARNPYDVYHSTAIDLWRCLIYFVHSQDWLEAVNRARPCDHKSHMIGNSTRST